MSDQEWHGMNICLQKQMCVYTYMYN